MHVRTHRGLWLHIEMLQGYKASAFPLPDSPTLRSNSLPCTLQSLTTDSTGKYWISPRHTEHWGSIEAPRWFTHTWLERERCPNVSTAARYAHACGGWFEDIDGLAGGSLDHNARSFREMCASALTHVSREITKVCVSETPSLACGVFLQGWKYLSDCVSTAGWFVRGLHSSGFLFSLLFLCT